MQGPREAQPGVRGEHVQQPPGAGAARGGRGADPGDARGEDVPQLDELPRREAPRQLPLLRPLRRPRALPGNLPPVRAHRAAGRDVTLPTMPVLRQYANILIFVISFNIL